MSRIILSLLGVRLVFLDGQSKQRTRGQTQSNRWRKQGGGPRIEIDYCYTFTKHRHELQEGEDNEPRAADQRAEGDGDDAARRPEAEDPERKAENPDEGKVDYRDQYGLTLVAAGKQHGVAVGHSGVGKRGRSPEASGGTVGPTISSSRSGAKCAVSRGP